MFFHFVGVNALLDTTGPDVSKRREASVGTDGLGTRRWKCATTAT